ncbi:hypothetical protein Tco_0397253 [Tanacetum coccineum]
MNLHVPQEGQEYDDTKIGGEVEVMKTNSWRRVVGRFQVRWVISSVFDEVGDLGFGNRGSSGCPGWNKWLMDDAKKWCIGDDHLEGDVMGRKNV